MTTSISSEAQKSLMSIGKKITLGQCHKKLNLNITKHLKSRKLKNLEINLAINDKS